MAPKKKPLILTLDPVEPEADASAPDVADASPAAAELAEETLFVPPNPGAMVQAAPPASPPRARREPRPRPAKPSAAPPAPDAPPREAGPTLARWAYPAAWTAALLWAGCLATFVAGYERRAPAYDFAPFRYTVTAGLALLPAALMLVFAYMVRQSARLAEEARRTRALADSLSTPAVIAAAHAGGAAGVMREEITRAEAAAAEAGRRLSALHASLSEETRLVTDAAAEAERAAARLGERLQTERGELGVLSGALDAQLAASAEGAARHARLAAEASDLAQANLQEAQAALAARTADLNAAAVEAGRAAEAAGGGLSGQTSRLERITADLRREQRAWSEAAQALFSDEEAAAARIESQRARFTAAAGEAREEAESLAAASSEGAEALRRLMADAVRQVEALAEVARTQVADGTAFVASQRAAIEADARAALDRLTAAAESARAAAAQSARELAAEAEAAGEAVRLRIEGLAETAFSAGRQADQAFDTRLQSARRAIEAQASLVEDAGLRSAARIEAGIEAVRTALGEAEGLASEMDRRFAEVRAAARISPQPPPAEPEPPARVMKRPEPAEPPAAASSPEPAPVAELRPRLRLASPDEALFAPLPSAGPTPAPEPEPEPAPAIAAAEPAVDGWSWKDLLTTMDDGAPAMDDDALAEAMIGEIEAMGVDPGALLPRARIDEIARAVDAGDRARAREAVRRLAPAAVRRLSRRVLTDKVLRGQADLYRHRYGELIGGQALGGGGSTSTLLGSDPGRAFLLLDAAVGDLH